MCQNPVVSVIIPTFNRADWLKESIDSVLSQTFTDYELIVVDDGSTDHTQDILALYPVARAVYQANRGVSAARNKGIQLAKGELIALLDSDDLWLPEKLSAQVAFFKDHPDALICQTEETWVRNGKRVNPKVKHRKRAGDIFEDSLHLCLISPSAVMMRRSLFDRFGLFNESFPACEDYDLWLRVTCEEPAYLIEDSHLIKRGGHSDQLSANPCLDRYRIQSIHQLIASGRLNSEQMKSAAAVLVSKAEIYRNGCIKRGRVEEAEAVDLLAAPYKLC